MTKYDWVTDFMKAIQRDYLFYDKVSDRFHPIHFDDEVEEMVSGEKRHYKEVCFKRNTDIQPINDEYVYHQHQDAMSQLLTLEKKLKHSVVLVIFAFRHSEDDWGSARTIEDTVLVNKLGFGIFRRKNSLESSNTEGEDE